MNKNIGELIKELRLEKKMSVEELAKKIGKSRATVYRYENNEIEDLPYTVLNPIAEALGTTPAYLLDWDNDLIEYVAEEDKDTVKHFMKYNPYDLDMTDEEMSIKKLLNTFGYDLSHNEGGYYIIDDYGTFLIENDELTSLLDETKKYLQFNVDKMSKERRKEFMRKSSGKQDD